MNNENFSKLQKMSPAEILLEIQKNKANKTSTINPADEFEEFIITLWRDVFPDLNFDKDADFFSLGGTSLQAVFMLSKIKTHYQIELDLMDLFREKTIHSQSKLLRDILLHNKSTHSIFDFQQDINLINEIKVSVLPRPTSVTNILLTGASGFLGIHLLKSLLDNNTFNVFCILRGASSNDAKERLLTIANKHQVTLTSDQQARITCFCGDISKPNLGLSDIHYAEIAESCDLIIHSAAVVNFIYPYEQLRQTNVLGLLEIIKLAVNHKMKPIHFVSTIGIFGNQFSELSEIDEKTVLSEKPQLNGYFQSKWVSEKICMRARDKGIPIAIYRPSGITINSRTLAVSDDDLAYQLMQLSLKIRAFADLKSIIDIVPVDYVATAIAYLATHHSAANNNYHLLAGNMPSARELMQKIPKSKYIKILPYSDYIKHALSFLNNAADSPLHRLIPLLMSDILLNSNLDGKLPQFKSHMTDNLLDIGSKPPIQDTLISLVKAIQRH